MPKSASLNPKDRINPIKKKLIPMFKSLLNASVGIRVTFCPAGFGIPGISGIMEAVLNVGAGIERTLTGLIFPKNIKVTNPTAKSMTKSPAPKREYPMLFPSITQY